MNKFLKLFFSLLFLCVSAFGVFAFETDSLQLLSIDKKLKEYIGTIEKMPISVKNRECDFLLESCHNKDVRTKVMSVLYNHYRYSPLMGDDAVAVHISDKWISTGKGTLGNDVENMMARIYSDFNRRSLIGCRAPSINMESIDGKRIEVLGTASDSVKFAGISDRYRVLYFYTPDCSDCKKESILLAEYLKKTEYKLYVDFIYTGTQKNLWLDYRQKQLNIKSSFVTVSDYWDPEELSDFHKKYGVLQTPRMFLIDKNGVIIGRSLNTDALASLLEKVNNEDISEKEASNHFFEDLFNVIGKVGVNDMINVAKSLKVKLYDTGNYSMYKKMTGDYLYFLSSQRGKEYRLAEIYVIDSLIFNYPKLWTEQKDSLQVIGFSSLRKTLLLRTPIGSKVPAIKVNGLIKKKHRSKAGKWQIDKLKHNTYIVFYTEGCNYCKAELSAVDSILKRRKVAGEANDLQFLLINMDEIMSSSPSGLASKLLDSFDLSVLPFIIYVDSRGIVKDKYISLVNN